MNGEYLVPRVGLPRAIDKIVNGWELSGTALAELDFRSRFSAAPIIPRAAC
jgi:hypothetical protein